MLRRLLLLAVLGLYLTELTGCSSAPSSSAPSAPAPNQPAPQPGAKPKPIAN